MSKVRKIKDNDDENRRPALTPEGRENQMIALAMNLAEEQLRDGTASSQVITHFLKLGSTRERIEKEYVQKQKELVDAKIETLLSAQQQEEIYKEAIKAMKQYSGNWDDEEIEEL